MSEKPTNTGDLIRQSWANGSPTDWFEQLYASAAEGKMRVPWAFMEPNPEMLKWLEKRSLDGRRALVVGCGLGDDAEALAARGFDVTAFDISETAIGWARERFPESTVKYQVADLLKRPAAWEGAFDFVLESRTIQSLPYDLHPQAVAAIAGCVATDGTLLVLCHGRNPEDSTRGIPWPLSTRELALFNAHGLTETQFEDYSKNGLRRFRVTYRRQSA